MMTAQARRTEASSDIPQASLPGQPWASRSKQVKEVFHEHEGDHDYPDQYPGRSREYTAPRPRVPDHLSIRGFYQSLSFDPQYNSNHRTDPAEPEETERETSSRKGIHSELQLFGVVHIPPTTHRH